MMFGDARGAAEFRPPRIGFRQPHLVAEEPQLVDDAPPRPRVGVAAGRTAADRAGQHLHVGARVLFGE